MNSAFRLACTLSSLVILFGACGESSSDGGTSTGGGPGLSQGGAQDFGLFRDILQRGEIPGPETLDELGFFNEHKIELPAANCGENVCLHGRLGVMGNMITGSTSDIVMIGLNTPIDPSEMSRPPLDLAIAVDTSGSMSGDAIEYVRLGLEDMLPALGDQDLVTLIAYSDHADMLIEEVDPVSVALENAIRAIEARGLTNIYDGLRAAFESLPAADPNRQRRVVLLSDGVATAGILEDDRIIRMARSFSEEGIGLTTIGVGTEFNVYLMQTLSEVGAGNFYFLEDPAAVREVFTEEVQTFLVPIAQDVVITLSEGSGYWLTRIHGTRLWSFQSNGARIEIPSLFIAGRETTEDDQLGRRGGGGAILAQFLPISDSSGIGPGRVSGITIEWEDPATGDRHTDSTTISSVLSPGEAPADGYFDDDTVEKAFVMLNIYMAFEMAAERAADGALSDALKILNAIAPTVEDWLVDNDDEDIEADLLLIELFIDNLLNAGAGLSPPSAAPLPEPWDDYYY